MNRNKTLNEGLRLRQEQVKKETLTNIEKAILSYREESYQDITIQMLINATGYTRPTFSKKHVQELLKKYKIGKYKTFIKLPSKDEDKLKFLENELYKSKERNLNLQTENNQLNNKVKTLTNELEEAKREIEYLNQDKFELLKKIESIKMN